MAAFIPGFIVRPVKEIRNLVCGRVQHEFDEGLLKAQTAIRTIKFNQERVEPVQEHMRGSIDFIHVRAANEYQKVIDSYGTLREREATSREKAKAGRIFPIRPAYGGVTKRTHVSDSKCTIRQKDAALCEAAHNPHRAAASRNRRRAIERPVTQGPSNKAAPNPVPQPKSDNSAAYMKSLRILYPASDSYEERKKHTDATFTSIFGPEHVHFGVGYASGHSSISDDPVLAEYSYKKNMEERMGYRQAWQAEQRCVEEHEQRRKTEREAERARKLVVFEHYCAIYDERVRKMVNAGDQFHARIGHVLRAYENGNVQDLQKAAHLLTNNTLEPILELFEEMRSQIVLESIGAQELRNAWPSNIIEQVLTLLTPELIGDFPYEVHNALGYMLQSLRAVCQPIIDAVPLESPLNEPEPHVFDAKPLPVPSFEHYLSEKTKQASQNVKVEAPPGENVGLNLPSLSALIDMTKAAKAASEIIAEAPPEGFSIFGAASGGKKSAAEEVKAKIPEGENAGKNYSSFAAMLAAEKSARDAANKKDEQAERVRKRY